MKRRDRPSRPLLLSSVTELPAMPPSRDEKRGLHGQNAMATHIEKTSDTASQQQ